MSLLDEFSNEELARLTGAHITSVRRWRRCGILPKPIRKLLEFVAQNRLDHWGWIGWVFRYGRFTAPATLRNPLWRAFRNGRNDWSYRRKWSVTREEQQGI